jgi:filamentous hemagglutinin family protein
MNWNPEKPPQIVKFLVLLASIVCPVQGALAQIVPDNTLGSESSRLTPNATVRGNTVDRIDGGATRGTYLFHSFSEFNVGDGQQVYFSDPAGIETILTRVTGNNVSNILGTLGVDGPANLFLLNPRGVVFGPNARLDIAGSFVVSTGDRFTFPDGTEFSATNPQAPPLLTVNVSIGLQPGQGAITHTGDLSVGQDLTLSAGALTVQGALTAGQNLTLEGQNQVQVQDGSTLTTGRDLIVRSPIRLLGGSGTPASAPLYTTGGYFITEDLAGNMIDFLIPHERVIVAEGDVSLGDYNNSSLYILAGGGVQLGNVTITSPETSGTVIGTISTGTGGNQTVTVNANLNRGVVDVRAGIDWSRLPASVRGDRAPSDLTPIFGSAATNANIVIGSVDASGTFTGNTITNDGNVLLTNQYQPNPLLSGDISSGLITTDSFVADAAGSVVLDSRNGIQLNNGISAIGFVSTGGNVTLRAANSIHLTGFNGINTLAAVRSGDIRLDGGDITLDQFTLNTSNPFGLSGNIRLTSRSGPISIQNMSSLDASTTDAVADVVGGSTGGSIRLEGRSLSVANSTLTNSTSGSANAGIVSIDLNNEASLNSSQIFAPTTGAGNGGNITLRAASVNLVTSSLQASTAATGRSGDIAVAATSSIQFDSQSAAETRVVSGAGGTAGNMTLAIANPDGSLIPGGFLELINGSSLLSNTAGQGSSGNISIRADHVLISGDQTLVFSNVDSLGQGAGGNINILANSFSLSDGAKINSSTAGQGIGGDIDVTATSQAMLNNGQILATTAAPINGDTTYRAGNIQIETGLLTLRNGTEVSAETQAAGQAGDITLIAPTLNLETGSTISASATDTATAQAQGGNITVNSDRLTLSGTNTAILAETRGAAPAGNLTLQPSSTNPSLRVEFADNTKISAATSGSGSGGSIFVTAPTAITLQGAGRLSTESSSTGQAGEISLSAPQMGIQNGVVVSAATAGGAIGGNIVVNAPTSFNLTGSELSAATNGQAQAGKIEINAGRLVLQPDAGGTGAEITTSTQGAGSAGNIAIQVANTAEIRNSTILSTSNPIDPTTGAILTTNPGAAGQISLNTANSVLLSGVYRDRQNQLQPAGISVQAGTTAIAGNITVDTPALTMNQGAAITATTSARTGGSINLQGLTRLLLDGSTVSASTANGQAGQLTIRTQPGGTVTLSDRSRLASEATTGGSAGSLEIVNPSQLTLDNATISVRSTQQGQAGSLTIGTPSLQLSQSAITAETEAGRGGNIALQGIDTLQSTNSTISTSTQTGRAGTVSLNANQPTATRVVLDGGLTGGLLAQATGAGGVAGDVTLNAQQITVQNGAQISASNVSAAEGGNVTLSNVSGLQLNRGVISASTDTGRAGNVSVNASGPAAASVVLTGVRSPLDPGGLLAQATGAGGVAGDVTLNAQQITVQNGAQISSSNESAPVGGNVRLSNVNALQVQRGEISASTATGQAGNVSLQIAPGGQVSLGDRSRLASEATAGGNAGSLQLLTAERLILRDRSRISVSSVAQGRAGDLTLAAHQVVLSNQSTITANTVAGQGGNLSLTAVDSLRLRNGSEMSTSTQQGQAGNLTLITRTGGQINLENSRIAAEARSSRRLAEFTNQVPIAGSLTITSDRLNLRNNSTLTVSSPAGQAGSLTITARQVQLDDGQITAETGVSPVSGEGANIELRGLNQIVMRNGSLISARASNAANGGNLTINARGGYVIGFPFENNDIIATAELGTGGNINIQANRIFGFFDRSSTRLSFAQLRANNTSDISASSQFGTQGVITFDVLGIDPSRGLVELPSTPVDASQQIAQGCGSNGTSAEKLGTFVMTGRGGLPPDPEEQLSRAPVVVGLVTRPAASVAAPAVPPTTAIPTAIVEATRWLTGSHGETILTTQAPSPPADLSYPACRANLRP